MSKCFWLQKQGWAQLWPQQTMLPSWVTGKIGCAQGSIAVPKSYYSHCFLYNTMSVKKINVSLWCSQLSRKTSLSLWVHAFLLWVIQSVSGESISATFKKLDICYTFVLLADLPAFLTDWYLERRSMHKLWLWRMRIWQIFHQKLTWVCHFKKNSWQYLFPIL